MLEFSSVLCQIILASTGVSAISSILALRNDISDHNDIIKGNEASNERAVVSMRFELINCLFYRSAVAYPLIASGMLIILFFFYSHIQGILMGLIAISALSCLCIVIYNIIND